MQFENIWVTFENSKKNTSSIKNNVLTTSDENLM